VLQVAQRIRVLRLIARLNIGGPAIHVVTLTAGLDPARYESRLVTGMPAPHEGDMSYLAAAAGIELFVLPELGRDVAVFDDAVTVIRLVRLMREFRPHIVHTHTAKAGAVGRLAARLARVPVVVHTFHGHVFTGYFGPIKTRLTILTERALARMSDRVVTLSERLRDEIAEHGVARRERIEVIPLGLDLAAMASTVSRLRGRFRTALDIKPDERLIGSVGRLAPIKNVRLLLRAARALRAAGWRMRFVIVGDGELRADLEAEARALRLNGDVIFTGWRQDLPAVYADLDLLVNTSLNEGTPVAVIEAMAAGVPVVATRVGGVPDLITDGVTGTLVPSDDTAALTSALVERIERADDSRRMAAAACADVVGRYSTGGLIRNMDALYRQLLLEKGVTQIETRTG